METQHSGSNECKNEKILFGFIHYILPSIMDETQEIDYIIKLKNSVRPDTPLELMIT